MLSERDPRARYSHKSPPSDYYTHERVIQLPPGISQLLEVSTAFLKPDWNHVDSFVQNWMNAMDIICDKRIAFVFENSGQRGLVTLNESNPTPPDCLVFEKPDLDWEDRKWRIQDRRVIDPINNALKRTPYYVDDIEGWVGISLDRVFTGTELPYKSGVLIFELGLQDARITYPTIEMQVKSKAMELRDLRVQAKRIKSKALRTIEI